MKTLTALALVSIAMIGCRSKQQSEAAPPRAASDDPACICGTPEAAIETCVHPVCLGGHSNPDNPECACGTLGFDNE